MAKKVNNPSNKVAKVKKERKPSVKKIGKLELNSSFNANIYQLGTNIETGTPYYTFFYQLTGDGLNQNSSKEIAKFFAAQVWDLYESQERIKNRCGKHRVYKLAKGKQLFFALTVNGKKIVNEKLFQQLKVQINFCKDKNGLAVLIEEFLRILSKGNLTLMCK